MPSNHLTHRKLGGIKGRMEVVTVNGVRLHVELTGPGDAPALVFANSLGTDFRIWDRLLPHVQGSWRVLRYDKRGHGLSDCPPAPYHMGDLVADAAALMDRFGMRNGVVVGLSIGGLIAQGLAAERPDLVRAMVLMDTAARIGNEDMWADRVAAVRADGIAAIEDSILERWFSKTYRNESVEDLALWRNMLTRTPAEGYIGCAEAIAQTDLLESTARLTLPTLAMAGAEDGSTPPDLVRETANLITGSAFHVIQGAGHLPGVEDPAAVARLLNPFLAGLD